MVRARLIHLESWMHPGPMSDASHGSKPGSGRVIRKLVPAGGISGGSLDSQVGGWTVRWVNSSGTTNSWSRYGISKYSQYATTPRCSSPVAC